MSIVLEALTRLVEVPEVNNPMLILIVGCAGLLSNLLGFVVLGGHGHSHGPGEHSHEHGHAHDDGHEHVHDHPHKHASDLEQGLGGQTLNGQLADEDDRVADVLPEAIVHRAGTSNADTSETVRRIKFEQRSSRDHSFMKSGIGRSRSYSSKSAQSRLVSIDDMSIHPASFRQDIIAAGTGGPHEYDSSESSQDESASAVESRDEPSSSATETSPLLKGSSPWASPSNGNGTFKQVDGASHCRTKSSSRRSRHRRDSSVHDGHKHTMPQKAASGGHSHNHGDMGMNAMILHVIGDALGNVGVIITALIIWKTDFWWRFYADPAVSLVITAIILNTSIPLTRATARILLQATPDHISIKDIRQDIEGLPGVVSCHHIHVWQLSDTKIVASLHLQVTFPIDSDCGEKYMQLAKRTRKCLHGYGIHSATIQPEFCLDRHHYHNVDGPSSSLDGATEVSAKDNCLISCADDCLGDECCSAGASGEPSLHKISITGSPPPSSSHHH